MKSKQHRPWTTAGVGMLVPCTAKKKNVASEEFRWYEKLCGGGDALLSHVLFPLERLAWQWPEKQPSEM
jgi:hypothetical protein